MEKNFEPMGHWWNDRNIDLIRLGGTVYALHGWNGEKFTECWECSGDHFMEAGSDKWCLTPIYRFEAENIDLNALEENSDEWLRAMEIVDYAVSV